MAFDRAAHRAEALAAAKLARAQLARAARLAAEVPCPTYARRGVLTPHEVDRGYQCGACVDRAEGLGWPS